MAIAPAGRSAHGDEHGVGLGDGRGALRGEEQPARLHVGGHQRLQPRLENGHLAPLQALDLAGVLVDAGDHVAEVGEAGPRHQAHIARADHRYPHRPRSLAPARGGRCGGIATRAGRQRERA